MAGAKDWPYYGGGRGHKGQLCPGCGALISRLKVQFPDTQKAIRYCSYCGEPLQVVRRFGDKGDWIVSNADAPTMLEADLIIPLTFDTLKSKNTLVQAVEEEIRERTKCFDFTRGQIHLNFLEDGHVTADVHVRYYQ